MKFLYSTMARVYHDLLSGEEEEKFEEGSGSSDEDTMEEDCYECKVIIDSKI